MGFWGTFDHSVDTKGRVVVPAAYRDDFRDGGHLLLRVDHIALYDPAGWTRFIERFRELKDTGAVTRPYFNQVMALSSPVTPDSQGRFGLPSRLRTSAGIGGSVVFVGVDDYFALHAPETAPHPEGAEFAAVMAELDRLPL